MCGWEEGGGEELAFKEEKKNKKKRAEFVGTKYSALQKYINS